VLGVLEENLLVLLCYNETNAPIIRGLVEPALFGGPYRLLAIRIYEYLDRFKKPPGDHVADLLSDKLEGDKREAGLYSEILESIYVSQKGINAEYVMSQLETFIRRQSMRSIAIDLNKALQRDTEQSLEEAEQLIAGANRVQLSVFDAGTRLSDKRRALSFLDLQTASIPTGIPELDKRGLGPTRKEMYLFVADAKAGKSWWLIHLAKMALMHRVKVVHLSLEMSEERTAQRYFQALFAVAKRKEKLAIRKIKRDSLNRIEGFDELKVDPKLSFDDPGIRKKLEKLIDKWSLRLLDNIIVKQFPTGQLTVPKMVAYLDNLEATQRFVPDLLVVDYPDLMKLDKANIRGSIDEIYKDIRGVLVSRNIAGAVVSQAHRAASKARQVNADNVAEAYSKVAHADVTLTYSQTDSERGMGLARLHVAAGRSDQDKFSIVITQQYGIGGFALDSAMMRGNYWGSISRNGNDPDD
jgi:replicative DNA helicase